MGITQRSRLVAQFCICTLLLLNVGSSGHAQVQPGNTIAQYFRVPPRDGEFRKAWSPGIQGIGCMSTVKPDTSISSSASYSHCLRLGALKLGMEFYQLQIELMKLGSIPEQQIVNAKIISVTPDGIRTVLIPIVISPNENQNRLHTYLVAVLDAGGAVQALQLTGKPSDSTSALHFSSITLGMPKEKVADILGYPSSVGDVPEIHGRLWSYAPFPFTIEFKDGGVYSVRIHSTSDGDIRKAFVPLAALPD